MAKSGWLGWQGSNLRIIGSKPIAFTSWLHPIVWADKQPTLYKPSRVLSRIHSVRNCTGTVVITSLLQPPHLRGRKTEFFPKAPQSVPSLCTPHQASTDTCRTFDGQLFSNVIGLFHASNTSLKIVKTSSTSICFKQESQPTHSSSWKNK